MIKREGFTLVEMVVVMAMIAVFSLISVSALLSARGQSRVDAVTEDIISNIRDAQNRSISSVNFDANNLDIPSKAWSYKIGTDGSNGLIAYTQNGVALDANEMNATSYGSLIKITITPNIDTAYDFLNVSFASPFGRAYITNGSCDDNWKSPGASRPAQDWYIDPSLPSPCSSLISVNVQPNNFITINIESGNASKSIRINANGDSYVE